MSETKSKSMRFPKLGDPGKVESAELVLHFDNGLMLQVPLVTAEIQYRSPKRVVSTSASGEYPAYVLCGGVSDPAEEPAAVEIQTMNATFKVLNITMEKPWHRLTRRLLTKLGMVV